MISMERLTTEECPICQESYKDDNSKRCMLDFYDDDELESNDLCRHTFCDTCIFAMSLEDADNCPLCRRKICPMVHNEEEMYLHILGEDNKVCKRCCRNYVEHDLIQDCHICRHSYCTECLEQMASNQDYECKICDDNIKEIVIKYYDSSSDWSRRIITQ